MDIIKKHYEKVVLGFLLLSFVVSLIYLLQIMSSTHDTSSGNSEAAKNTLVIQRQNQKYEFKHAKENFSITEQHKNLIWQERNGEGLIGYGRPGLAVPMKALRCSQCKKIMPWAQLRKNEMRCPFEACSQDLRDPGEPEDYEKILSNFDSDADGMPDRYEIRLGLNPNSAEDADQDKDGDNFSNWFEYYCKTNPNDIKGVPALDKMLFLSNIEVVKLPIKLTSISTFNPSDKSSYKIFITIMNHDSQMALGTTFTLLGKRYKIVDAVKRNTTEQGTSFSQKEDDSTIWIMPADSKDPSDRIEVRARKDVYDNKTRKAVIRDVRFPNKRKSNLTAGKVFKVKVNNADKDGVSFKVLAVNERSVDLEYVLDKTPRKMTLELVKQDDAKYDRFKKSYVKGDAGKSEQQPVEEQPQPSRRSNRSRRR